MRIGKNPLRDGEVDGFPRVMISAITHLPHQKGYHEKRLQIVKMCLLSMREAAGMDCGVMIWDNGSCEDLLRWLHFDYRPDFIMTGENVGKINARTAILNMLPDNTILAMCDDDMYFYPDWLKKSYKLLRAFPNVGVVSGYPTRRAFHWATINTLEWARDCKDAKVDVGRFIPEQWEHDYAVSLGRDWEFHKSYTAKDQDYKVTYKDKYEAFLTAHHCQWMGYAGRLKKLMKYDYEAMANDKPFDESIDTAGLLRLSTTERLTRHMGNIPEKDIVENAKVRGLVR
jgi:hypothetical protein